VEIGRGELRFEPDWLLRPNGRDVDVHPDGQRLLILIPEKASSTTAEPTIVWRTRWFDDLRRVDGRR
jgi:hypothetical protein